MLAKIYHFLDRKYNKKSYLFYHKIFKLLINVLYPIAIKFNRRKTLNKNSNIVVSLTSFPARIKKINLVIESLLRQKVMPNKIVLYLSLKQFSGIEELPKKLRELENKGLLNIEFVEDDLRSHKKYFYAVNNYSNKSIITVDDDMFYPEDLIEIFTNASKKYKDCVCCLWAKKVKIKNRKLDLYNNWTINVEKNTPQYDIMPIGCAGVLYPKKCFDKKILLNPKEFMQLCPLADDIWLKFNTTLNKVKSVKLDEYNNFVFIDLIIKNNKRLCDENVQNSKNDEQINKLIKKYPQFLEIISKENNRD